MTEQPPIPRRATAILESYSEWVAAHCLAQCEDVDERLRAFGAEWSSAGRENWRFRDARLRCPQTFSVRDRREHRRVTAKLYRLNRRLPEVLREAGHIMLREPATNAVYAYRAWLRAYERERSRRAKKGDPEYRELLRLATITQRYQWQRYDAALRGYELDLERRVALSPESAGLKRCPECDALRLASARRCECGYDFWDSMWAEAFLRQRAELARPEVQRELLARNPNAVRLLRALDVEVVTTGKPN